VIKYLLREVQARNIAKSGSTDRFPDLKWSPFRRRKGSRSDAWWLRSGAAFVALKAKTSDDDLLRSLLEALIDWRPLPSRLFLTKLRAMIDEYGIAAQGRVVEDNYAHAYWYHRLLESVDPDDRSWLVAESVSRHSNQLMQWILPHVEQFAKCLIEAELEAFSKEKLDLSASECAKLICGERFDIDLGKDEHWKMAISEHNALVCGTERTGSHLSTGHVFSMADGYWLCLSPACDMVPSQIRPWRIAEFGERLPFIGVKLHEMQSPREQNSALANAQSNRFLFLNVGERVRTYCFNDPSDAESNPRWYLLFAENRGRFNTNSDQPFQFSVSRERQGAEKDGGRLEPTSEKAVVVGQLRYEYALNFVQKLGASLTRVGLDFGDIPS